MEKDFAEVENRVLDSHQRPELEAALETAPNIGKEKVRREHSLTLYVSYKSKCRLPALTEKHNLTLAHLLRLIIKCAQEEFLSSFLQFLRKTLWMNKLKK